MLTTDPLPLLLKLWSDRPRPVVEVHFTPSQEPAEALDTFREFRSTQNTFTAGRLCGALCKVEASETVPVEALSTHTGFAQP